MPDKKLTDSEIVKALEEWRKEIIADYQRLQLLDAPMDCFEESHANTISRLSNTLDLINRQKAEIKRLTSGKCIYLSDDETTEYCVEGPCPKYKTEAQIKAEAYKEFAKKMEERIAVKLLRNKSNEYAEGFVDALDGVNGEIDNLLKELVGEDK